MLHLQFPQQARHAGLHRVAQADRPHRAVAQHRAGHHRHRVGVVQQPRLRRRLLHVPRQVEHHRNGAQRAEDAADPQRVANGLTQAVALGHLEVDHRARLVTAHLNGVDHEVGVAQRRLPRSGAQVGLDPGAAGVEVAVQGGEHRLRLAQALGVDVVQGDGGVAQRLGQQAVADDVLDEHGRAGADEGDLHGADCSMERQNMPAGTPPRAGRQLRLEVTVRPQAHGYPPGAAAAARLGGRAGGHSCCQPSAQRPY